MPECFDPEAVIQSTPVSQAIDAQLKEVRVRLGSILTEPRYRVKFTLVLLERLEEALNTVDAARMHLRTR